MPGKDWLPKGPEPVRDFGATVMTDLLENMIEQQREIVEYEGRDEGFPQHVNGLIHKMDRMTSEAIAYNTGFISALDHLARRAKEAGIPVPERALARAQWYMYGQ